MEIEASCRAHRAAVGAALPRIGADFAAEPLPQPATVALPPMGLGRRVLHRLSPVLLCLALPLQAAEAPPARAAAASNPLPRFQSALHDYRPYRADEPLRDWREANDEVGRLGGHMGHMETRQGEPQGQKHHGHEHHGEGAR